MHLNFELQKSSKEFILMGRTMTNSRRGTQAAVAPWKALETASLEHEPQFNISRTYSVHITIHFSRDT